MFLLISKKFIVLYGLDKNPPRSGPAPRVAIKDPDEGETQASVSKCCLQFLS